MSNYKPTVGIEVHAELKTATKIFSDSVNGYANIANTNVNVVDLGYPGVLPTLNKEVVNKALTAALILNCKINKKMHFDRKNYFYPDLPKGYQITQARTPIGVDGYVEIEVDGKPKKIGIHDIHIEEDTCKSIHYNNSSLLDFNRAGVPLVEIVTKPDISSSKEAILYLEKLRELLLYADVSDCKIEEGSMRCDVNVSISKTEELGTKIEVKNIGSITNVGIAVESEIKRQEELLNEGETLHEETRRFDDKTNSTILMRVKETGNDYRYFPEADIPFVTLSDEHIDEIKKKIPMLADERRKIYLENGISLINANKIIQNREVSEYLNKYLDKNINLVIASNLLLGDIAAYLNKNNKTMKDTCFSDEKFIKVVNMLNNGDMSSKIFKEILNDLFETNDEVETLFEKHGISKLSDDDLRAIIKNIIDNNSENVLEYKNGNERLLKYFIGQVMKETKGSANPELVNTLLLEELSK
mgnify:FL=1